MTVAKVFSEVLASHRVGHNDRTPSWMKFQFDPTAAFFIVAKKDMPDNSESLNSE